MVRAPYRSNQGKGELLQGGVHVPLIISGPDVSNGKDKRLAHTVDLFATVLDFAGVDATELSTGHTVDGISLVSSSRREWVFAEQKGIIPTGVVDEQAVRNKRYKLIVDRRTDTLRFFDLKKDPFEAEPLDMQSLSKKERKHFLKLRGDLESYIQQ